MAGWTTPPRSTHSLACSAPTSFLWRSISPDTAAPWGVALLTVLVLAVIQALFFSFGLGFLFLGNRISGGFLPCRDFGFFVRRCHEVRLGAASTD